ncbi:hypothetical protein BP5796_00782 [Coleophoma crateriformis]|uniref:peptidyl-tRNA hydrolase n=1 Tax=Coleophoma crateriformis TaxID=565419 RepID=A0A3D8T8X8_9HELO|nr:hypothetical protein BP5796_00782 [Coleophoma crateriformis]
MTSREPTQISVQESWDTTPTKKTKNKSRRAKNSPVPASSPERHPSNNDAIITPTLPRLTYSSHLPMATKAPLRLLVCSIGNPAPYLQTYHSAGHLVVSALQRSLAYPPFQKSRAHGNGLVSEGLTPDGARYTLWQSASLMNISGPGVVAAWRTFLKSSGGGTGEDARLVVVHDELELALGQVRVKKGEMSAKGHNGLKSIKESMANTGQEWWRIGVGIGRPLSREKDDVARFVLSKMKEGDRERVLGCVRKVEAELGRLAAGG